MNAMHDLNLNSLVNKTSGVYNLGVVSSWYFLAALLLADALSVISSLTESAI